MTKYFTFGGAFFSWPHPWIPGAVAFAFQTELYSNFNDTTVIANAAYMPQIPIWGHRELHATSLALIYNAANANTSVSGFVLTGAIPLTPVQIPVVEMHDTIASREAFRASREFDIALEPSGAPGATSRVWFALVDVDGYANTDDLAIAMTGWYRDAIPVPDNPDPQKVILSEIVWPPKTRRF